ncbi:MAG TPA: hypothetical protein VGM98_18970 [Schlesneria sp.]
MGGRPEAHSSRVFFEFRGGNQEPMMAVAQQDCEEITSIAIACLDLCITAETKAAITEAAKHSEAIGRKAYERLVVDSLVIKQECSDLSDRWDRIWSTELKMHYVRSVPSGQRQQGTDLILACEYAVRRCKTTVALLDQYLEGTGTLIFNDPIRLTNDEIFAEFSAATSGCVSHPEPTQVPDSSPDLVKKLTYPGLFMNGQ